jgi:DNA polymerase
MVTGADDGGGRTVAAKDYAGAGRFLPPGDAGLDSLAEAATACRGCDLFERSTQVVFGSGNPHAQILLIGEQPGDSEDKQGKPFVGPAGRLLDRALAEAGIDSDDAYVTNAVKHFRWREDPRGGKRRIHERPDTWQVRACGPWLMAEIERVGPHVIVALGATAGQALFGSSFRVGAHRGEPVPWRMNGAGGHAGEREHQVVATIHPSAVLRAPDRDDAFHGLVHDLAAAAHCL